MSDTMTYGRRVDQFGLESPFASETTPGGAFEEGGWASEGEDPPVWSPEGWVRKFANVAGTAGAALASADDPPGLQAMLSIPGRFDDPKRDRALEMDGTRFGVFLNGRPRRDFATGWLASQPALALAAKEPGADLKAGDIAKAWFVIHDVGVGATLTDTRFKAVDPKVKKNAVHGFLNRSGYYAATHDFAANKMGTVFEFLSRKGLEICGKKTINIETVPDIEEVAVNADGSVPPPKRPDLYASIGFRKGGKGKAKYFKWTHQAFDVLADLYILASARAGHLLTITAHKEMDRNLARSVIWREYAKMPEKFRTATGKFMVAARNRPSDYHGDPYAFDVQALYDIITRKLNALGGRQMPPGARYGVHPLRLRKADGGDVGNGDSQMHEFPHQSDPVVKKDGTLMKAGWWNPVSKEASDEAPWSQSEWSSSYEADGQDEWSSADEEAPNQYGCGAYQREMDASVQGEGLDWLDFQGEGEGEGEGESEGWSLDEGAEAWSESPGDFEEDHFDAYSDFEGGSDAFGTDLLFESSTPEATFEVPAGPLSPSLLKAIPDRPDAERVVPFDYRLNAKAIVGKLSVDLGKLKEPDTKDIGKFAKDAVKVATGKTGPAGLMIKLLIDTLKNIPAGYMAASASRGEQGAIRGFSHGVVTGAEPRPQAYVLEMFGHIRIERNLNAPTAKVEAANYAAGLIAGYAQGRALTPNQRAIFWKDLRERIGSQSHRGAMSTWTHKGWEDWYRYIATQFAKYHLDPAS